MNKLGVFLGLMLGICVSYAQIYKWIDSQGNVHFSDTPHPGAEEVKLPDMQSYSPPPSGGTQTPEDDQMESGPVKLKQAYTKIAIINPKNNTTIRNNQGYVAVTVQIEPKLFPGDKVQLIYDNAALGEPQRSLGFEINGMYRGTHTLAVQIIDPEGNMIESSDSISIFVFRPRVGMVPNGGMH